MPNEAWMPDDDRLLARLYAMGDQVPVIAERLGRSESSIKTRVTTLGILRRKTTNAPQAEGNTAWVIGTALASTMRVEDDRSFDDLLGRLDAVASWRL